MKDLFDKTLALIKPIATEVVCTKSLIRQRKGVKTKWLEKGKKYFVFPVTEIGGTTFWFWTILSETSPTTAINMRDEHDTSPVWWHRGLRLKLQDYFDVPENINKLNYIVDPYVHVQLN